MKSILIGLILLALPNLAFAATKAPTMYVCVNGSAISVKTKCGKNEIKANLTLFQGLQGLSGTPGPQGPAGRGINGCRSVINDFYTSGSTAFGNVTCNSNEFLMTHGYTVFPNRLTAPRELDILTANGFAYSAEYTIQADVGAGVYGENYTLEVTGVCCTL